MTADDILALREKLQWSQERLAEFLGLDRSSISRMENGQTPKGPTKRLLEQLAASSERHTPSKVA